MTPFSRRWMSRSLLAFRNLLPSATKPKLQLPNLVQISLLELEDRWVPATITWNNAVSPTGGSWDAGTNWIGGAAPTSADDAVINLASAGTVALAPAVTDSVKSVTTNSNTTFSVNNGSLTLGTNQTTFGGNVNIPTNGKLIASTGSKVTIGDNVAVSVSGTLTVTNPASFVASQNTFGGSTDSITVGSGGTMALTNATFSINGTSGGTAFIRVQAGAHLTATGSTIGWNVLAWDNGAVLNSADVTSNTVNATVYVQPNFVPLLTNNTSFKDVFLNAGSSLGATPIDLPVLGSASTAQRYIVSALDKYRGTTTTFTIASGATLNFKVNTVDIVNDNAVVQVNGTLTVTNPASFMASQNTFGGANDSITVGAGGTMAVTNATFSILGTSGGTASVRVQAGGHLTTTGSSFGWNVTAWDNGAILNSGEVTNNAFTSIVYVQPNFVPLLTNNKSFGDVFLNAGSSLGATPIDLPVLGTASTTQRYIVSALDKFQGTTTTFTVGSGATLNFKVNTVDIVNDNTVVQVNGTLTVTNPASFMASQNTFGGANDSITVGAGGTMAVTNATFSILGTSGGTAFVRVKAGGQMTAVGSSFGWNVTAWDNGAILNSGEVTNNAFTSIVYVQPNFVPLLTNNKSFGDVFLNAGSSLGATPIDLPVLGTASTTQRYIVSALDKFQGTTTTFTVGNGAKINVLPNTAVVVGDNAAIMVLGNLSLSNPASFQASQNIFGGSNDSITVGAGGFLVANNTNFTILGTSGGTASIQVASSGNFNMVGGSSAWNNINLQAGGTTTMQYMLLTGQLTVNSGATINIQNNDFSGVPANGIIAAGPIANIPMPNNYWGSTLASDIATKIKDHVSFPSTIQPTIVYTPVLPARPVRTLLVAPTAISYALSTQTVSLSASLQSPTGNGLANVNGGTVTFTILDSLGATIDASQTRNVASGTASAMYTIPGGTNAGSYTILAQFSGSGSFSASSDNSQTLTINPVTTTTSAHATTRGFRVAGGNVSLVADVTSGSVVSQGAVVFRLFDSSNVLVGTALSKNVTSGTATADYVLPASLTTGTYTIQAAYGGTTNLGASSDNTQTLVITPAATTTTATNATVTFSGLAQNVTLTSAVTSLAGLVNNGAVTFTVKNGATVISSASGNVSNGAVTSSPAFVLPANTPAGTYIIQADFGSPINYNSSTDATHTLVVNQATQSINLTSPPPMTFAPGQTITLSASGGASGNSVAFSLISGPGSVSGSILTVTGAGSIVVAADQVGNTNYTAATQVQTTITINKASQAITLTSPPPATFAPGLTITLSATGGASGNTVAFSIISGPGTISGNVLTITGAGSLIVAANQVGNTNYTAATQVQTTVTINQASQAITLTSPPPATFAPGLTITLSATGGASGNTVAFSIISGPGTVSGNVLTITGAGSLIVAANQAGNTNYTAATQVQTTVTINQASQAITFNSPPPATFAPGLTVNLSATGGASGNAVAFSLISGPGTVSGNVLAITGAGSIVIAANQAGDTNYTAASTAQVTITINQATQAITFPPPSGSLVFGNGPQLLTATSTSGLTITYTVLSGPGTISGSQFTITDVGTIVVAADQPGDANYLVSSRVQQSFVVVPGSQSLSFTSATTLIFAPGLTLNLSATGGASGNPAFFSLVSGPGTVSGNVLTVTGVGNIVIAADQAGNSQYNSAPTVQSTIAVQRASQSIAFPAPPPVTFAPGQTVNLNATGGASGNPVVFTLVSGPGTVSGNVLRVTGAGSIVVAANQLGNANYTVATSVQSTVVITPIAQAITFPSPLPSIFSPGLTISLNATGGASGNPVTFSIISGPGVISGSILTITGAGSIVVTANQAGNANYTAATSVQSTATINPAPQAISFPLPPPVTFASGLTVNLTATGGGSGLPVTFRIVSGPGSISGNVLAINGAGSITVAADQMGDANYTSATTTQSLIINKATQAIVFASTLPTIFATGLTVNLIATGGASGAPVVFDIVSGPGTITGNVLAITGAGSIVVAANQAGDANDLAAPSVQSTVTIRPASQTIVFASLPPTTFVVGLKRNLSATGGASGNPVSYLIVSGPGTISGSVLTVTGAGRIVVAADQAGDANYTASETVTSSVVIEPAEQTIIVSLPTARQLVPGSTIKLDATGGSSGNPVIYSLISGPGILNGDNLSITGPGTIVLQIQQSGNESFRPTSVIQSIVVRPSTTLVGVAQFAAGADVGGSTVTFYNPDGTARFTVAPYGNFTGGVRTAAADFNRDGIADLIVGTGPGIATRVVILDGKTQAVLFDVAPFEASFKGGVYISAGDVTGDGIPDLAITPDEGGGPRVDIYSGASSFPKLASFFGIDDTNFRGGARSAIADMTGDGVADLIVVAGFGGGPRVAAFDGKSLSGTPQKIFGDFFAFEQALRNGIFVTAGDINGDGFADLIAGGGPGGGPRVLVLDGKSLLNNQYVNLANFFGGDINSRGGIRVAVKDLDGDNRADLVVGSGAGAGNHITGYLGKNIAANSTPTTQFDFDALAGFTGGVFVG